MTPLLAMHATTPARAVRPQVSFVSDADSASLERVEGANDSVSQGGGVGLVAVHGCVPSTIGSPAHYEVRFDLGAHQVRLSLDPLCQGQASVEVDGAPLATTLDPGEHYADVLDQLLAGGTD